MDAVPMRPCREWNGGESAPFQAAIFDLDNVLYPLRQYALGGYRAVAEYLFSLYGIRVYDELAELFEADRETKAIERALKRRFGSVDAQTLERCYHVYRTHAPRLTLYPDAALALAYLRNRSMRLALVARNSQHTQSAKVAALNLHLLLDCVLCAGDSTENDSIGGALTLTELALDLPLSRMVYVGGGPLSDYAQARQYGMTTVQVDRAEFAVSRRDSAHETATPQIVIPSLAALPTALIHYATSH